MHDVYRHSIIFFLKVTRTFIRFHFNSSPYYWDSTISVATDLAADISTG